MPDNGDVLLNVESYTTGALPYIYIMEDSNLDCRWDVMLGVCLSRRLAISPCAIEPEISVSKFHRRWTLEALNPSHPFRPFLTLPRQLDVSAPLLPGHVGVAGKPDDV